MGKFVYFTSAEKRQANEVDLPSFLLDRGEKLIMAGRDYRLASDHSITVRANRWYDHAARRGGHAISFVRQFYDKTFPEAVTMLLGRDGQGIIPIAKQEPEPQEPKPFALPKPYLTMRRMYAYLTKHRCIDRDVVTAFVREELLYEDTLHHNCVFVGKDHAGQAKYAGLRGTYDRDGKGFRGDVTGSDKNVGFAIPHDPTSNQVRVFEAPIDLMSYLSLHRELINAVALCGLYDGALETYLKDNPHIKRITLCLDSDAPGRAAAQQLKDKYSARGYAVTVEEPRSGKDWNEYLQKRNTPERGR